MTFSNRLHERLGEISSTHYNPTEYFQWLGDLDTECTNRLSRVSSDKGILEVVKYAIREMRKVKPSSACKPTHEMYWDSLHSYMQVLMQDFFMPEEQRDALIAHAEKFKGKHDAEVARLAPSLAKLLRRAQLT